jgi:RNA polymerase sigma factor (sigma-70 family)
VNGSAPQLVDHLFRHEAGRMVAALVRALGTQNLTVAEDAVQDVLCAALEAWKYGHLPDNPAAWLMRAAKNRAIDLVRKGALQGRLAPALQSEWTLLPAVDALFDEHAIRDDDLRLMFSCCDPALTPQSQLAIVLRYPCGFGISEIAHAFLASQTAVEKRLFRARESLAARGALFDVRSDDEVRARLDTVHDALYLLFNEGYHGAHPDTVVREDLCYEALRLSLRLLDLPAAAGAKTHALIALMCFHAARLEARIEGGELVPLDDQDRSRWDRALIAQGVHHLATAAGGDAPSAFHFEAAIAALHCQAPSVAGTDWERVARLYGGLFELRPSPVVALSRAIALGMAFGARRGLEELDRIAEREKLASYPFYAAALGEFHARLGEGERAAACFGRAQQLSRNGAEEQFFARRRKDAAERAS